MVIKDATLMTPPGAWAEVYFQTKTTNNSLTNNYLIGAGYISV